MSSTSITPSTASVAPSTFTECTKSDIGGALPKGSVIVEFECTIASPAMWAAARVKSGPVFFLSSIAGPWEVTPAKELCGARRKEVPKELRSYCD